MNSASACVCVCAIEPRMRQQAVGTTANTVVETQPFAVRLMLFACVVSAISVYLYIKPCSKLFYVLPATAADFKVLPL